jgi:hypothetical protein
VLQDPRVSRRHLLLQPDGARVKAVSLVEGGTTLNGQPLEAPASVDASDVLVLPDGTSLRVQPVEAPATIDPPRFALELAPGQSATLHTGESSIGGAWQDVVVIDGWPPGAIRLVVAERLTLTAMADGVVVAGTPVVRGRVIELALGEVIAAHGRTLRVVPAPAPDETTIAARVVAPRRIELDLLPNGGRLTVHVGASTRTVLLSERRFALAVALLAPAPPRRAGEFIDDDELFARVWPRQAGVDRGDLNQLVHRLRGDLSSAGLDGARLIERLPQGGGARFVIEEGTTIERRG